MTSLRRHFSHFHCDNQSKPTKVVEATWAELTASLREPVPHAIKSELPMWSPARFHNGKEKKDVISVSLLGFDGDQAPHLSPDALREALRGYRFFAHTSSNSKKGNWRWRIIFDTEREMSAQEYEATWLEVRNRLPFPVGEGSKNANRCWYYPCGQPTYVEGEGIPVPIATPVPVIPALIRPKSVSNINIEHIAKHWAPEGKRNDAYLCVFAILAKEGKTEEEIRSASLYISEVTHDEEAQKRLASIRLSMERVARGDDVWGWPKLRTLLPTEAFENPVAEKAIDVMTGKKPPKDPIFGGWDTPPEPVIYLIDGLITPASVNMFVAHGGSLKTWAALTMALSVIRKEPWLGRIASKGRAIIVDYESGRTEIHRRISMLGSHDTDNLGYLWPDTTTDKPEFWDVLPECALLIIDSLAASTPVLDENKKEAALPLMMARHYAEHTGAAVLFIHHANKGEKKDARELVRGSSALLAALDTVYLFDAPEGRKDDKTSSVACIKARRGVQPDPFEFNIRFEKGCAKTITNTPERPVKDIRSDEAIDSQIRLAAMSGPVTVSGLCRKLGVRKQKVCDSVKMLIEAGELRDTGKGYETDSYEKRKARILPLLDGRLTINELARASGVNKTLLISEFEGKTFAYVKGQGCYEVES